MSSATDKLKKELACHFWKMTQRNKNMESFLRVKKKSKYRPQIKPLNGGPDPKLSLKLGSASNKLERGLGLILKIFWLNEVQIEV